VRFVLLDFARFYQGDPSAVRWEGAHSRDGPKHQQGKCGQKHGVFLPPEEEMRPKPLEHLCDKSHGGWFDPSVL
jgi:hypothetical protein